MSNPFPREIPNPHTDETGIARLGPGFDKNKFYDPTSLRPANYRILDENRYRRHAQEHVCTAIGYEKPARKSEYRIEVHVPALGIYFTSHTLVFFSYLSRSDISFKSNHTHHIFERHYLSTILEFREKLVWPLEDEPAVARRIMINNQYLEYTVNKQEKNSV